MSLHSDSIRCACLLYIVIASVVLVFVTILCRKHAVFLEHPNPPPFCMSVRVSPRVCRKILKQTLRYLSFSETEDTVDQKMEAQYNIFDATDWSTTRPLDPCSKLLRALVGPKYHPQHLTSLFVRKYSPDTRKSLPCHFDDTTFSIVIALNDPEEYEGGDFVCYPEGTRSELTAASIRAHGLQGIPTDNHPSATRKLSLGEVVVLYGKGAGVFNRSLHCVRSVTHGTRYTLCAFYDIFDRNGVAPPPRHPHMRQFRMR